MFFNKTFKHVTFEVNNVFSIIPTDKYSSIVLSLMNKNQINPLLQKQILQ